MNAATNMLRINEILPNGDCGLMFTFHQCTEKLQWIHALADNLFLEPLPNQLNVIPALDSLVLFFKEPVNPHLDWHAVINSKVDGLNYCVAESKIHTIPVCYEAGCAIDLQLVCNQLKITKQQLLKWHTEPVYQVAMLGFLPGFAYLQGNHENIRIPRKPTPAVSVPAGSVAIADGQSGIYSLASPGGWHVIGCTPTRLLDWQYEHPLVFKPLDRVKFEAIELAEFNEIKGHD